MHLNILCSGYLVRYPLGGQSWHHLQYLVGFKRLGHDVTFFEHYGWPESCFDPARNIMTSDPSYGVAYLQRILRAYGLNDRWCYLAEDGTAYGMPRKRLAKICRECDVYFNLSNINWIPELEYCPRRVLVDRSEEHTSELQSRGHLVCRLLPEKKKSTPSPTCKAVWVRTTVPSCPSSKTKSS